MRCLCSIQFEKHWERWAYIYLYIKTNNWPVVASSTLSRNRGAFKTDKVTEDIRGGFEWIFQRGSRRDVMDLVTAVNSPRVAVLVRTWYGGGGNNGSDEGNDWEKFGMHCYDVERDSKMSEIVRRLRSFHPRDEAYIHIQDTWKICLEAE